MAASNPQELIRISEKAQPINVRVDRLDPDEVQIFDHKEKEKEKEEEPSVSLGQSENFGSAIISNEKAGSPQRTRTLAEIGEEIKKVIEEKLIGLRKEDSHRLLQVALAGLINDVQAFMQADTVQCGLAACMNMNSALFGYLAEADLDEIWFQKKVMKLAKEYDRSASSVQGSFIWEVPEKQEDLIQHYKFLHNKELTERAQFEKERVKNFLTPGQLTTELANMYGVIFDGISDRTLQSLFGHTIKEIHSTPEGGSRLQNVTITTHAKKLLDSILHAYYKGCNAQDRYRQGLIKNLLKIMGIALNGKTELEKVTIVSRLPFFPASSEAEKNHRAKGIEIYTKIYGRAGRMVNTLQVAYPGEVEKVAEEMKLSIKPRR